MQRNDRYYAGQMGSHGEEAQSAGFHAGNAVHCIACSIICCCSVIHDRKRDPVSIQRRNVDNNGLEMPVFV